jgi:hypothetical protein
MQVASPEFVMLVFSGSDVDQVGAGRGKFCTHPAGTCTWLIYRTWFPGALAVWSAIPFAGLITKPVGAQAWS